MLQEHAEDWGKGAGSCPEGSSEGPGSRQRGCAPAHTNHPTLSFSHGVTAKKTQSPLVLFIVN